MSREAISHTHQSVFLVSCVWPLAGFYSVLANILPPLAASFSRVFCFIHSEVMAYAVCDLTARVLNRLITGPGWLTLTKTLLYIYFIYTVHRHIMHNSKFFTFTFPPPQTWINEIHYTVSAQGKWPQHAQLACSLDLLL